VNWTFRFEASFEPSSPYCNRSCKERQRVPGWRLWGGKYFCRGFGVRLSHEERLDRATRQVIDKVFRCPCCHEWEVRTMEESRMPIDPIDQPVELRIQT